MFDTLRRAMLIGIGAADAASERARQMIDDMVSRGEMTMDQGRELYNEYTSRSDEQRRMEYERTRMEVREMLKEVGVADRSQVAMLENRIDKLESKVDEILERLPEHHRRATA